MITETPNYARKICKPEILGASEKYAENGFGPAVNRRVVGSSPTCGAKSRNVADVKTGLSLLSRQGLSQLSHKVLVWRPIWYPRPFLFGCLIFPLPILARVRRQTVYKAWDQP